MKNPELADILKRALRYIPQEGDEEMDLAEDIMAAIGGLQSEPASPTGSITPGPWRVSKHDALRFTFHVNAGPAGYEQNRVAIVTGDSPKDCSEGNAQLISACPEIAEALEMALESLDETNVPEEWDCRPKIRAALRKAGLL